MSPNDLFAAHLHIADRISKRLALKLGRLTEFAEAISIGRLALLVAAHGFDDSRGIPFEAYAAIRVRGAIIDTLCRKGGRRRAGREPGAFEARFAGAVACGLLPIGVYDEDGTVSALTPENQEQAAELAGLRDLVDACDLSERQAEIVRRYHFGGETMTQIANSYGLTESRVSQVHDQAIKLLRKFANKMPPVF